MKNKTLLIISREYLTRIQKKSFIIITILMPVLLAAMIVLPVLLVQLSESKKFSKVLVVDESEIFINNFTDDKHYSFSYRSGDIEQIKKEAFDQDYDVVLQILANTQSLKSNIYYKKNLPSGLQSDIESQMDDIFFNQLLRDSLHIEMARFENLQNLAKAESVTIQIDDNGGEKEHDAEVNQIFGMMCGIIIYFIIIMFASQVLRGVLEEKSNRIVEVLISSVKPTQLLVGKIVGIALVGLTQLAIWVVLSVGDMGCPFRRHPARRAGSRPQPVQPRHRGDHGGNPGSQRAQHGTDRYRAGQHLRDDPELLLSLVRNYHLRIHFLLRGGLPDLLDPLRCHRLRCG